MRVGIPSVKGTGEMFFIDETGEERNQMVECKVLALFSKVKNKEFLRI